VTHRFRDLLALEPLNADELTFLLDQSKSFQEIQRHPLKKLAVLRWRFSRLPRGHASALGRRLRVWARTP
jgi:hypothetical protein